MERFTTDVKVKFVMWYDHDDKEFCGDSFGIHAYVNGKFYKDFGDEYHNKASETSDEMIETLKSLGFRVDIESEDRNVKRGCDPTLPRKTYELKEILGVK